MTHVCGVRHICTVPSAFQNSLLKHKAKLIPVMAKRSPWCVVTHQTVIGLPNFLLVLKKKLGRETSLGFSALLLSFFGGA